VSDERLSQEEINALLNDVSEEITPMEKDALGEIGNIAFGSGATALSLLLSKKVKLTTPVVEITTMKKLIKEHPTPCVAAEVAYIKGLEGTNLLLLEIVDAAIIADLMQGGDGTDPRMELGEMELSAIGEAMNQMVGKASTSMSSLFDRRVEIAPPNTRILDLDEAEQIDKELSEDKKIIKISFRLEVSNLIDSSLMLVIPFVFGREMACSMLKSSSVGKETAGAYAEKTPQQPVQPQPPGAAGAEGGSVSVQPVQFSSISSTTSAQDKSNLNLLLDVPLQISVELGSTRMKIKEILDLGMGSVVELDRLAGEPVDILVNGKIFAKGEVVVIDENFGIKITDIVSPITRVNNLQ